jgi:hypothetical protein
MPAHQQEVNVSPTAQQLTKESRKLRQNTGEIPKCCVQVFLFACSTPERMNLPTRRSIRPSAIYRHPKDHRIGMGAYWFWFLRFARTGLPARGSLIHIIGLRDLRQADLMADSLIEFGTAESIPIGIAALQG